MHGPILFLDFDGVVVTRKQADAAHRNFLCPDKVAMVKALCDRTGARVVISSTWRVSHDCRDALAAAGLGPTYLFDDWATPLDVDCDDDVSARGLEIAQHVQANKIDRYVILDDMPVLKSQAARHVQPDPTVGITQAQMDLAFVLITNPMDAAHA
ncbi:HAD domain-containing protein [Bosea massiliensis]|uniref:HAD domain-containing protein n=1 Tax=Bosea massiliensis TaxID=151419 RepID=A0ABW0P4G5_9HYPH